VVESEVFAIWSDVSEDAELAPSAYRVCFVAELQPFSITTYFAHDACTAQGLGSNASPAKRIKVDVLTTNHRSKHISAGKSLHSGRLYPQETDSDPIDVSRASFENDPCFWTTAE
jgi:hypothetical protein